MDSAIFEGLYQTLPIPVVVCGCGDDLTVVYLNACAATLMAAAKTGLSLHKTLGLQCGSELDGVRNTLRDQGAISGRVPIGEGKPAVAVLRANTANIAGRKYYILYLEGDARCEDGMRDEYRNVQNAPYRGNDILQTITDNIDSAIYVSDLATYELKFISRMFAKLLGKEPDELLGKKCWKVLQKDMSGPCPFCPIAYLFDHNGEAAGGIFESELKNTITGNWYWAKDSIIRWTDGSPVHIQSAVDITYRKRYEEQLQHFASIDAMTGIFNREWGYKLLKKKLVDARITGDAYTLCFIDLDGLKIVNDTYGHAIGDDMIQRIIATIRSCVRSNDMLCRWGGDEFLLLLHCDPVNAKRIMDKIEADVDAINKKGDRQYTLAFSYGIEDFSRGDSIDSVDSIITAADNEMYRNKMAKRR